VHLSGNVYDSDNLDDTVYLRYREILDRALLKGLSELRFGNALNWDDIVQREVFESYTEENIK
jgi:hypothetical protein